MGTSTLLLDTVTWDLVLDANGDLAAAAEPYALAQDAASAIQTYLGEVFFDTTIGVPWLTEFLGKSPSPALLKAKLEETAETVPGVASATVFLSSFADRAVTGQVQVTPSSGGPAAAAAFSVSPAQGG